MSMVVNRLSSEVPDTEFEEVIAPFQRDFPFDDVDPVSDRWWRIRT